ncbi:hypothetical protein AHAS_Ahas13G0171100 [Arachis hypogaea]
MSYLVSFLLINIFTSTLSIKFGSSNDLWFSCRMSMKILLGFILERTLWCFCLLSYLEISLVLGYTFAGCPMLQRWMSWENIVGAPPR